ncbi:hypothetical protein EDC53_102462 [Phytobacter diazotrophicus]|nr:hypothetical protein EDC53_102462 [Phytobacter diazotrophicus]
MSKNKKVTINDLLKKQEAIQEQINKIKEQDGLYNECKNELIHKGINIEEFIRYLGGVPSTNKDKFVVHFDGIEYSTSHKKLIKKLTDSDAYQQLILEKPEMNVLDTFMRAYSTQYCEAYPLNAKYKDSEFYLNANGTLNSISQVVFEKYCNENGLKKSDDLIKQFKEAVLIK